MRVLLVWPYGFDGRYVLPLSLAYLESNLPRDRFETRILDCVRQRIRADSAAFRDQVARFAPDVVGVSSWATTHAEALAVLRSVKQRDPRTVTVMGGAHATSYTAEIMKERSVDYLFRGESELSFPRFLDQIAQERPGLAEIRGLVYRSADGTVQHNEMECETDLDKILRPDYESIGLEDYIREGYRFNTPYRRNAPIWVTRGCPYVCGFCSAPIQNGRLIRRHSVGYVTAWIQDLYHRGQIRKINIIDDNFTFDPAYAKDVCRAVIGLQLKDLRMGTPNGIRVQRTDPELLGLMKRAGWETISIAPESGSKRTLARMRKNLDVDIIPGKVREIQNAGLKVVGFFVLGYPGETKEDLRETVRLIRKCRFNFFYLNNFQPLPGTPIYDELLASGEIEAGTLPTDYSDGRRVYTPSTLSGCNFPALILREYLVLMVTNPLNLPYIIRLVNLKMVAKKVLLNLTNMLRQSRRERARLA
jgi:anaerobic magnesium-protoporphyrin IX monomethyl ester cyclase